MTKKNEDDKDGASTGIVLERIVMQDIGNTLVSRGWKYGGKPAFSGADMYWYKQFETKTPCFCNDEKPGLQVVITGWDFTAFGRSCSFEVSIRSEPKDGTWIDFKCYSIVGSELFEKLDSQIKKLLKAWEAINA